MNTRSSVSFVLAARGLRGFGDGFATIILPAYLSAIGFAPLEIGIVATASLLGTALLTLGVGGIAPRYDLRSLMLLGAALAVLTGIVFPVFSALVPVALIAFFGTINPTSGDIGVLIPLEQTLLSRAVADQERTRTFARYSFVGATSTAVGTLAAAAPDFLVRSGLGERAAFTATFYGYAALGLICLGLYWAMPRTPAAEAPPAAPLGPSRGIVYKLAALFSLDSFAGGFIGQSLLALWLFERFNLSLSAASVFFFWSSILSALSFPIAARLSRRFGLVNTMVFTHVPSSILLIMAAFCPDLTLTLVLLLLRSLLSQMDVPTRTSYVMAVVTPAERAAAASVTNVPRTLAAAVSPSFSGALLGAAFAAMPLVICSTLKIAYDLALLFSFRHIRAPEEMSEPH